MNLEIETAPTSEPLVLSSVKDFLRVCHDDEDTLIEAFITAARQQFEHLTGRTALTTTYKAYFDGFRGRIIDLEKPPIQSVTSVKYYDDDQDLQTVDSSTYRVEANNDSGQIVLLEGETWPTCVIDGPNSVVVEYIAGYTSESTFPEIAKRWMETYITDMYETRQSESSMQVNRSKFVDHLLDSLIVPWRFKS